MAVPIVCPECKTDFNRQSQEQWTCPQCGYRVKVSQGIPIFTNIPLEINPSSKIERSAEQGSVWRRFNWKFIEDISRNLPDNSAILDVGAGRGDFKTLFLRHEYIGLDVYPYPELDLAVDLIEACPFRPESFDLVVLANVIEHVYEYRVLVRQCAMLLKPGGRVLITVPFLLKLHQEPVDFHRYTRHALLQLAKENGLVIEILDGYYNPLGLLDEGLGNIWQFQLPASKGFAKFATRAGIYIMQKISNLLKHQFGNGRITSTNEEQNPNVLGYQCLFQKPV